MTRLPVPLQRARDFDCGAVHVQLSYTPVTEPAHVSGRTDDDPFRDRFELRLSNRGLPDGATFVYQTPQPLQFFFSVLRRLRDGGLRDVTVPQLGARHTGVPQPRTMSFAASGEPLIDRISFFALATIMPDHEILPGEYLVRLSSFELLTVGSSAYRFEPLELPLTIIDPPPP